MAIGIERPYFVDMVPLEPLFGFKKVSRQTLYTFFFISSLSALFIFWFTTENCELGKQRHKCGGFLHYLFTKPEPWDIIYLN